MEGTVLQDLRIWTDDSDDLSIYNTSSEEKRTRSPEVSLSPALLGLSDCSWLSHVRNIFNMSTSSQAAHANCGPDAAKC